MVALAMIVAFDFYNNLWGQGLWLFVYDQNAYPIVGTQQVFVYE